MNLEEIKQRHAQEIQEAEARLAILALLPEGIPEPSVSNIKHSLGVCEPYAWLSFSLPYGKQKAQEALAILIALEAHGAEPLPVTLCKWDNYRPSPCFGPLGSIPEQKGGCFGRPYTLTWTEALAPLWVDVCQHTGNEVLCFYKIGGKVFRVSVDSYLPIYLQCRRVEYPGGWYFEGPCHLNYPKTWESIGESSVAVRDAHTCGRREDRQAISGVFYWQPNVDQSAFPLTPAQFFAHLIKEG